MGARPSTIGVTGNSRYMVARIDRPTFAPPVSATMVAVRALLTTK
jgi:hypothetical protein